MILILLYKIEGPSVRQNVLLSLGICLRLLAAWLATVTKSSLAVKNSLTFVRAIPITSSEFQDAPEVVEQPFSLFWECIMPDRSWFQSCWQEKKALLVMHTQAT